MKHERTYRYVNTVRKGVDADAVAVFSGPGELPIGPAAEFGGRPEFLNPEELFVAAINSCLMTTLFYFLGRSHIVLQFYQADAEGQIEKSADGFRFTRVQVNGIARVNEPGMAEKVRELATLAERYCLVSRSVNCPVEYRLQVEVRDS